MRNKEQIRAANALKALDTYPQLKKKKEKDNAEDSGGNGDHLTGFPALIIGNGLLATIAFSQSKGKDGGDKSNHLTICHVIAQHLSSKAIGCLTEGTDTAKKMADVLANGDSELLRLCTSEALAYLSYLRRFAKSGE